MTTPVTAIRPARRAGPEQCGHLLPQSIMAMEDYLGYRIVARDREFDRPIALGLVRGYAELATGAILPPTP